MKRILPTVALFVFMTTGDLLAQSFLIQGPVFSRFSVRTTVSVPDRGNTLLGSMSSAGSGRNTAGFGLRGSSVGNFAERRSVRSSVYIHDFRAMDPFLRDRESYRPPIDTVAEKQGRELRALAAYRRLEAKAIADEKPKLAAKFRKLIAKYQLKTRNYKRR